jgi:hypothetical protein
MREKSISAGRLCAILHVPTKIIEDTNEVAIKIGGHKLAKLRRFVLRLANDLRARGLPLCLAQVRAVSNYAWDGFGFG